MPRHNDKGLLYHCSITYPALCAVARHCEPVMEMCLPKPIWIIGSAIPDQQTTESSGMRRKQGLLVLVVSRVPCCVLERNQAALLLLFGTVLYEHAMVVASCICFQQRRCVCSFGNLRYWFGLLWNTFVHVHICLCVTAIFIFLYADLLWVSFYSSTTFIWNGSGFFSIFFTRLGGIFLHHLSVGHLVGQDKITFDSLVCCALVRLW